MKKATIAAVLAATAIALGPGCSRTGTVEAACLDAGRTANPALCRCVQSVADQTLSRGEQSTAARFFGDPQRAQDTRTSSSAQDNAFWTRYRNFTDNAARHCGS